MYLEIFWVADYESEVRIAKFTSGGPKYPTASSSFDPIFSYF